MYVRMRVGAYNGEVRGPMDILAARNLVATGQAIAMHYDDGGKLVEVTPEAEEPKQESKSKGKR